MKKILNRWITGVLCAGFLIAILPSCRVKAEAVWPEAPAVGSASAILMEAGTGTVLYEKNSQDKHYPASITKILTTLLAIENCDMDETVTFSADAVYKNEGDTSHISRDVGEQMTMEECLYGVMLASANECAYAVAEHVGEKLGGDYSTFIELMNQKADELGCVNTHFNNCNGLPDEEHWTCAYDMALISCAAYQNEIFREITGTGTYTIPVTNKHSEETILHNHHNMLYPYKTREYLYDYCTGGKTGYTTVANNTLVTYAEKDGMTLVCVVMYADTPVHYVDTTSLFEYGFSNFQLYHIQSYASELQGGNSGCTGLLNDNPLFVSIGDDSSIVLPKKASISDVTYEQKEGSQGGSLAELTFFYAGREVGSGVLEPSGASTADSIFQRESTDASGNSPKTIVIRTKYIFYLAGGIAVLLLLFLIIRLIRNRVYQANRDRQMRRYMSSKYGSERKRRRRRRRDRLFR